MTVFYHESNDPWAGTTLDAQPSDTQWVDLPGVSTTHNEWSYVAQAD